MDLKARGSTQGRRWVAGGFSQHTGTMYGGVAQQEAEAPVFIVKGILYWDITEVITAELEDLDAFDDYHVTPYKEWWDPGLGEEHVRVYSKIYNSDAMLKADMEMRGNTSAPPGPDSDLESFIVSALLYSDSTHLASFGNASLWPIYLFPGNVSKYVRSKPTSFSAHHIAYIPTVCCYLLSMSFHNAKLINSHSYPTPSRSFINNITTKNPAPRCSPV